MAENPRLHHAQHSFKSETGDYSANVVVKNGHPMLTREYGFGKTPVQAYDNTFAHALKVDPIGAELSKDGKYVVVKDRSNGNVYKAPVREDKKGVTHDEQISGVGAAVAAVYDVFLANNHR
jgi:hypothetical protein